MQNTSKYYCNNIVTGALAHKYKIVQGVHAFTNLRLIDIDLKNDYYCNLLNMSTLKNMNPYTRYIYIYFFDKDIQDTHLQTSHKHLV